MRDLLDRNGTGKYCTTAEEDNATLEAALRGSSHSPSYCRSSTFCLLVIELLTKPRRIVVYDVFSISHRRGAQ